jgi:glycosyltransferase involved in cell wall biosynthesis
VKLLFVTPYYAPAWDFGGPVRAASNLAASLARRGHEVEVWTSDALSRSARITPSDRDVVVDGVRVKRFPILALTTLERFNMFVTPGMRGSSGLRAFEVVHLHEFRTFQNAWLLSQLAGSRVPFVLTPHGSFGRRGRVLLKIVYDWLAGHRLVNQARFLTALSRREAAEIVASGVPGDRVRLLPNAAEPSHLELAVDEARRQLGWPERARTLLFLGRLHAIKGPDLLLEAFAEVRRRFPDLRLVFAGPDEGMADQLVRRMRQMGLEHVVAFTGALDAHHKEAAYAAADLLVLPSRSEGLPMTLLEALGRGKPVVCTEACAFEPSVSEYAEVVAPVAREIAAGIARALDNPQHATRRAASGREFVGREFSTEHIASLAEDIYAEACGACVAA